MTIRLNALAVALTLAFLLGSCSDPDAGPTSDLAVSDSGWTRVSDPACTPSADDEDAAEARRNCAAWESAQSVAHQPVTSIEVKSGVIADPDDLNALLPAPLTPDTKRWAGQEAEVILIRASGQVFGFEGEGNGGPKNAIVSITPPGEYSDPKIVYFGPTMDTSPVFASLADAIDHLPS